MRLIYAPCLCLGLLLGGCFGNYTPPPDLRPEYRPTLMSRQQLESAVSGQPPRALQVPGKIFVGGHYLFVNEQYQGIHVFDNADPSQPVALRFLRIPGNVDLAVRGNLLYADNGPDLVTLDIGDLAQVRVVGRTRNALPEVPAPLRDIRMAAQFEPANRPAGSIVVGWVKIK